MTEPERISQSRSVRPTAAEISSALLFTGLVAMNVYRAATRSVTHDEAFTYLHFAGRSWATVFGTYDVNNHVLHTILVKLSTDWLGMSELALRLPALAGGLLFFAMLLRLGRELVGRGAALLAFVALLALNPWVLDFLSMARGYGLSLGFFFYALAESVRAARDGFALRGAWLRRVSLALGLALAANLATVFPALALAAVILLALAVSSRAAGDAIGLRRVLLDFVLPGPTLLAIIVAGPLSHAQSEQFYFGRPSFLATVEDLVDLSLRHVGAGLDAYTLTDPFDRLVTFTTWVLVPALLATVCALVIGTLFAGWRHGGIPGERRAALVVWGTFVLSVAGLVLAHAAVGLEYPAPRTVLYLIPLALASATLLARVALAADSAASRGAGWIVQAALALVIVQFALQLDTDRYAHCTFDAGTRAIYETLRERHAKEGADAVRIEGCWLFEPAINFYREREAATWLVPMTREAPAAPARHTYYILADEDSCPPPDAPLEPIYVDARSHTTLAALRTDAATTARSRGRLARRQRPRPGLAGRRL